MNDFFDKSVNLAQALKANEYSPLTLAFIGDAVFEVLVRSYVLKKGNAPVNVLNKRCRKFVNAGAQSEMYKKIEEIVTDEELSVLKRGRNAKSFTKAKNQSVTDYRHATGLEALYGYLYLKGENERIMELFNLCMENEV